MNNFVTTNLKTDITQIKKLDEMDVNKISLDIQSHDSLIGLAELLKKISDQNIRPTTVAH